MNVTQLDEEAIYHAALGITAPEAREDYLRRVCRGDAALRGRVERLLRVSEQEASFLEVTPYEARKGAPTSVERPGTVVGPYRLVEEIGEGGMGVVYMAEQTHPVRRRVAVKVIKPGMDTRQVVARFEAERQALAMMDHPNIAKVHDGGTTDSGRPYFVMELVRGVPITNYCDRERLSVPERLELFVLVCRAVQHAHQKGVIHRDLKPSNILVTLHDGVPMPKVIDFGVAKATGDPLTERTLVTGFAQMIGTPLYMSPEQAGMAGTDVDTRSDIYSLGVLLYELLTGSTPFDGETFRKAAIGELQRIIREDEPPTPSTRLSELGATLSTVSTSRQSGPRKLSHAVRGELDWIVMKALEKDRTRRYETANDFAADVTRHLTNEPVEACPPSRLYHLRKFVRRNRSRIAALGLIASLGLALAVAVGWQTVERATRRAETANAVTQALDAAERSMQLAKWPDAVTAVSQAEAFLGPGGGDSGLRARTRRLRDDLTMVSRLDEIRQEMSAVKDDHFDTGLADRLYGEAFRDYGIAVESLGPDAVAAKLPAGSVREELVAALDEWARVRSGMHEKGDRDWKRLLAAARVADPDPWRNRVREAWLRADRKTLGELAGAAPLDRLRPCDVLLLEAHLKPDQAVALLRDARERRPGDFWLNHALGMRLLGTHPPRADEAIGYLRAASALRPESPGVVLNMGHALEHADRPDEAIAAYEQAIRLKPDYAMAYSNLGGALIDAGRFDEAIRACREAIRLNPKSAAAHGNLGRALTQNGELDEGIAALREAIRLEPSGSLAPYNLTIAYCKKVGAGLRSIQTFVDGNIVRLQKQRPFLKPFFEPRSPLMLRRYFVLNLLATSLLATPAFAGKPTTYKYTSFDVPGSTWTRGSDINHAGTIAGALHDAAGVTHAFYWSGGVFTQVDAPGATWTAFWGINDAGVGVGRTGDALGTTDSGTIHGFIFDGSNFTLVDAPGATYTVARGINLAGDIVGPYFVGVSENHGFLLRGGQFTRIDYPNSTGTGCSGINNNGQIVGQYVSAGRTHGFLLSGGQFTTIDYPKAVTTMPHKINVNGQVVGEYSNADGVLHGFVLSGGTYTAINFPNSTSSSAHGINDAGEIVGSWVSSSGVTHGFYAVAQ